MDIQDTIEEFFNKRSRPAPNRTIKIRDADSGEKRDVPVRYLQDTVSTLYTAFETEHPELKVTL
jgi:hypothetical protein